MPYRSSSCPVFCETIRDHQRRPFQVSCQAADVFLEPARIFVLDLCTNLFCRRVDVAEFVKRTSIEELSVYQQTELG